MRAYYTQEEIDAYNALTEEQVKALRKRHKVLAVKRGMSDIGTDLGQALRTTGYKAFCVSVIGLGALGLCTGFITKEPITAVLGAIVGLPIGIAGVSELIDENGYNGAISQFRSVKRDIKQMYWSIKNTNGYFPMPEEKKGRSL